MIVTQKEYKRLVALAAEKDKRGLDELWQVYCTSDMPEKEYLTHLRLIAEGA